MSQAGQSGKAFTPSSKSNKQEILDIEEELKKRQVREDGMSLEEKKNLLRALRESEGNPGAPRAKTPEVTPPPVARISYAETLSSNVATADRKSSSPESASSQQSGKRLLSQEKHSSSSDETMFGSRGATPSHKEPKEGQNFNANRARTQASNVDSTPDGRNSTKRTNQRQNSRVQQDEKVPKFKINPLEFVENGRDARLAQHYRSCNDKSCEEGGGSSDGANSDNSNRAIARLCAHLRHIAEICHNQRGGSFDTHFQWGTAIKIGETSVDGKNEPDEEASSDFADDSNNRPTGAYGEGVEDTTRRRKVCASRPAIYDFGGDSDDDEDDGERENSDEDFQLSAKRRKTAASSVTRNRSGRAASRTAVTKNVEPLATATTSSQESETTLVDEKVDERAESLVADVSDECTIHVDDDDETSDQLPRKIPGNKPKETEAVFPRRIVPPNPAARSVKITARKSSFDRSAAQSSRAKKPVEDGEEKALTARPVSSLRDDEIANVLEENDDDDSVIPVKCDLVEIRPLRLSSRMKMQTQRLVQLQEKEKEIESVRREQDKMKEEVIRLAKVQRVQQRVQNEKEKQKREEQLERAKSKREEEWRVFVAQGERKRPAERTELHPDGRPRNNEADIQTNNFAVDQSENDVVNLIEDDQEQSASRVRCPICNRSFTVEAIEAHAGACEEYDTCPPGISRSSSPSLTPPKITASKRSNAAKLFNCEVCDNFSTDKGKTFENHTTECIKRKKYEQPFTPDTIINVPTSPLRTVRTISEQTGSEINYKSQFEPRTRSNKVAGKKRKR